MNELATQNAGRRLWFSHGSGSLAHITWFNPGSSLSSSRICWRFDCCFNGRDSRNVFRAFYVISLEDHRGRVLFRPNGRFFALCWCAMEIACVYPQYLERKLHAHVYVYQYAHIGRVHIDIHKRVYAPIHVVYVWLCIFCDVCLFQCEQKKITEARTTGYHAFCCCNICKRRGAHDAAGASFAFWRGVLARIAANNNSLQALWASPRARYAGRRSGVTHTRAQPRKCTHLHTHT